MKIFKKLTVVAAAATLLFAISACANGSSNSDSDDDKKKPDTTQTTETTEESGESSGKGQENGSGEGENQGGGSESGQEQGNEDPVLDAAAYPLVYKGNGELEGDSVTYIVTFAADKTFVVTVINPNSYQELTFAKGTFTGDASKDGKVTLTPHYRINFDNFKLEKVQNPDSNEITISNSQTEVKINNSPISFVRRLASFSYFPTYMDVDYMNFYADKSFEVGWLSQNGNKIMYSGTYTGNPEENSDLSLTITKEYDSSKKELVACEPDTSETRIFNGVLEFDSHYLFRDSKEVAAYFGVNTSDNEASFLCFYSDNTFRKIILTGSNTQIDSIGTYTGNPATDSEISITRKCYYDNGDFRGIKGGDTRTINISNGIINYLDTLQYGRQIAAYVSETIASQQMAMVFKFYANSCGISATITPLNTLKYGMPYTYTGNPAIDGEITLNYGGPVLSETIKDGEFTQTIDGTDVTFTRQ